MVQNLLLYVAIWVIMFALFWLAGRLLGLKRPVSGPTGRAWLDAQDAFDRARRQHQRHHLAAALGGQPHRLDLPTLKAATTRGLGGSRNPGELEIPIREIVGVVDGAAGKFDRDFLPTDERSRWRFQEIVVALVREGRFHPSRSTGGTAATTSPMATTGSRRVGRSASGPSRRTWPRSSGDPSLGPLQRGPSARVPHQRPAPLELAPRPEPATAV
jgi:hypothetical protein